MKHSIFKLLLVIVFIIFASFIFSNLASAAIPTNMVDYAWAPNFGWINFGSKVTIDTTGNFTGYGWSPNIGWIRMGSDLTGPTHVPLADRGSVKAVSTATGANITGWMQACSAYVDPVDCGKTKRTLADIKPVTGTERGGWDGWFKMKDVKYTISDNKYRGFSWGDLVGGWVNFGAGNVPITPTVVCSSAVSVSDKYTVTWSAFVQGGSGPYDYTWTGDDSLSSSVMGVLSNTVTKSYLAKAGDPRTVNASVVVKQGVVIIGTCNSSARVGETGGGPGGAFSARCLASKTNNIVTWTAIPISNGTLPIGNLTYDWSGSYVSGNQNPISTTYVTGTKARVTIKDSANNSATSEYCSPVTSESLCNLNILVNGKNPDGTIATRESLKLNGESITIADTNPIALDVCTNNKVATSTPTSPNFKWKDGSCSPTASTINPLDIDVVSGSSKTICADFGGGGEIKITGGKDAGKNRVDVNCGLTACNYTNGVFSLPLAKIENTGGRDLVTVSDWGAFGIAANSCPSGSHPKICIGPGTANCINHDGTGTQTLEIDNNPKSIKFYFSSRCPGSDRISVFHRPNANGSVNNPYWRVKLSGSSGDVYLNLYYNDPDNSNL